MVCLFSVSGLKGQIRCWQPMLLDSNSKILYIGIFNRVSFSGLPKESTMTLTNGEIYQNGNSYNFIVSSVEDAVLEISQSGKVIFTQTFKPIILGDPKARIGKIDKQVASVEEVLASPFLTANIDNCLLKRWYTVMSFKANMFSKVQSGNINFQNNGYFFSDDLILYIKQLKRGDKIIFDDIKVRCPDCRTRILNPIAITIN